MSRKPKGASKEIRPVTTEDARADDALLQLGDVLAEIAKKSEASKEPKDSEERASEEQK